MALDIQGLLVMFYPLFTEHVTRALDHHVEARFVSLNSLKVFDEVWHKRLIHKLKSYSISGK